MDIGQNLEEVKKKIESRADEEESEETGELKRQLNELEDGKTEEIREIKDKISDLERKLGEEKSFDNKFSKLANRIDKIEDQRTEADFSSEDADVDRLRHELAQGETHETERIDSIQSRLEKLELDLQNESMHEKAALQRLERLDERVEKLEDQNNASGRLDELEEDFIDFSNNIDKKLDERIDETLEGKIQEKVDSRIEENTPYRDEDFVEEERVLQVENRVSKVEAQISKIMQDLSSLTSLVKKRL